MEVFGVDRSGVFRIDSLVGDREISEHLIVILRLIQHAVGAIARKSHIHRRHCGGKISLQIAVEDTGVFLVARIVINICRTRCTAGISIEVV